MSGLFDKLNLDLWYNVLAYLGGLMVIVALVAPIQVEIITNIQAFVLGLGLFFIGTGESKNHKDAVATERYSPGGHIIIQGKQRHPDAVGNFFLAVGILLVVSTIVSIVGVI